MPLFFIVVAAAVLIGCGSDKNPMGSDQGKPLAKENTSEERPATEHWNDYHPSNLGDGWPAGEHWNHAHPSNLKDD